jgi:hypothetical protein
MSELLRSFFVRGVGTALRAACATFACCVIIGCVGPKPAPVIVPTTKAALPASTRTTAASPLAGQRFHAITFECPSAGWSAELDQERDAWQTRRVFITLRRPSPLFAHAQVVTPITVATSVPADQAIAVYVRVAEAGQQVEANQPYDAIP